MKHVASNQTQTQLEQVRYDRLLVQDQLIVGSGSGSSSRPPLPLSRGRIVSEGANCWTTRPLNVSFSSRRITNDSSSDPNHRQNVVTDPRHCFQIRTRSRLRAAEVTSFTKMIHE
ncbi:unnamed protein product [Pleuronectes platessa]|uniref:Uncharacterized protein n=1 Tax=Pleuronectes platessa TaxID=8262 RepID=A0A9N7U9F8_PLEPL|nr:unnamed protein product [Pleuronectes platessa]